MFSREVKRKRGRRIGAGRGRASLAGPIIVAVWLLLANASDAGAAEVLSGRSVAVVSGDTLLLDEGRRKTEVRLADIGAPRDAEHFAPAARTLLGSLVLDRPVTVAVAGRADDGRVSGHVTAGRLDVNLEMVRRGAAWVCWEFAQRTDYRPHESDARRQRRGLWSSTPEIEARARCRERPPAGQPALTR
jgi:endonuclease YncB( thermonuclease family)